MVASRKGESELAVGNVIGSNIFNLLFILGTAVTISPIEVNPDMMVDAVILLIATLGMLLFSFTKMRCSRGEGVVSIIVYLGYTAYIIMREFNVVF